MEQHDAGTVLLGEDLELVVGEQPGADGHDVGFLALHVLDAKLKHHPRRKPGAGGSRAIGSEPSGAGRRPAVLPGVAHTR